MDDDEIEYEIKPERQTRFYLSHITSLAKFFTERYHYRVENEKDKGSIDQARMICYFLADIARYYFPSQISEDVPFWVVMEDGSKDEPGLYSIFEENRTGLATTMEWFVLYCERWTREEPHNKLYYDEVWQMFNDIRNELFPDHPYIRDKWSSARIGWVKKV